MKTDTTAETFNRAEQRAIGHFLTLVDKQFAKDRENYGPGISYKGVVKELQQEHGCYD